MTMWAGRQNKPVKQHTEWDAYMATEQGHERRVYTAIHLYPAAACFIGETVLLTECFVTHLPTPIFSSLMFPERNSDTGIVTKAYFSPRSASGSGVGV